MDIELLTPEETIVCHQPLLTIDEIITKGKFTEKEIPKIQIIKKLMEKGQAGLKHHGDWEGGLWQHTVLVTSYAYLLWQSIDFQAKESRVNEQEVIRCGFFHDFGKLLIKPHVETLKEPAMQLFTRKPAKTLIDTRNFIDNNYDFQCTLNVFNSPYEHTCRTIYMILNMELAYNDRIMIGIIEHHGGWADFMKGGKPQSGALCGLIHAADMFASQFVKI